MTKKSKSGLIIYFKPLLYIKFYPESGHNQLQGALKKLST